MPNTERKQPAISRVFSGSKFETLFGFCRALRVGDYIHVSGTAPIKDGKTAGVGDPAVQTRRCFEIIEEALKSFGADRSHVIRTRMFLTRIEDWQQVGAVHAEFFADVRPVATMVEVSRLIDPDWLVEIEAEAFFPDVEPLARDKRAGDPGAKSTS